MPEPSAAAVGRSVGVDRYADEYTSVEAMVVATTEVPYERGSLFAGFDLCRYAGWCGRYWYCERRDSECHCREQLEHGLSLVCGVIRNTYMRSALRQHLKIRLQMNGIAKVELEKPAADVRNVDTALAAITVWSVLASI
jgi:hypothetical protein